MPLPHRGPAAGLLGQLVLLAALWATVGVGAAGWGAGLLFGFTVFGLLSAATTRRGAGFGPADRVTSLRSVLAGGAAALAADSFAAPAPVALLVALASLTILLDGVDGWLARRTGTTSELGARFDMEVDAFLILAMSVFVAPSVGGWVLAIGAARYVFMAAGWFLPWLRADPPPRYWGKVVAVVQGVALTVAASGVLPQGLAAALLLAALVLLAESFGRQAWWLWRHRREHPGTVRVPPLFLTYVAGAAVWAVLALPADLAATTAGDLVAIPLGALLPAVAALLLPRRRRQVFAVLFGVLLAVLLLLKALNTGFELAFSRPLDPLNDWYYLGPGAGVLGDAVGGAAALAMVAAAVVFAALALYLLPLAALRLVRAAAANRRAWGRSVVALGAAWAVLAVSGLAWSPGSPMASTASAAFLTGRVQQVQRDAADRSAFAAQIGHDPVAAALGSPQDGGPQGDGSGGDGAGGEGPGREASGGGSFAGGGSAPAGLLAKLRGRDVLLVFVESYGRAAVEGSSYAPGVQAVLRDGNRALADAGFSARSGFLASPTFGGASWLAHSTLQSGTWVDSQQRYNQLLTTRRLTLSRAFHQAGWRTVSVIPSDTRDWPQGKSFYGFDELYDARNMGYRGPKFGYATMPDQYVLSAFQRLVLDPQPGNGRAGRPPVMAELDLVSSHSPWTPLPSPVPWEKVGDGSIFNTMSGQAGPSGGASSDPGGPGQAPANYGSSVEYSLGTIFSFVARHPDPDLVLVVLGDHQANTMVTGKEVTGQEPGHDVPVSIISADPAVVDAATAWGWQPGLLPGPDAPVWPMSAFRDRFLAAFSS